MALQISPSHWAHLCCLDCRRTSSSPEETHLRMQRRTRRVHLGMTYMQHARIHMRAHELSLVIHISIKVCCVFGDRLVCLLLVLRGEEDETKWETPWNWVSKHTHTYTHTCCLLPAQATK